MMEGRKKLQGVKSERVVKFYASVISRSRRTVLKEGGEM
jgi:hypothetical protein